MEKRDGGKVIKKGGQQGGGGGPRKISLQKLRNEGKGGKSLNSGGGKPGNGNGNGNGKAGRKGGKRDKRRDRGGRDGEPKLPKDPAAKAEALDRDLESYWVKGGHTEIAQARLDDELDGYFAAKPEEQAAPAQPETEEKKD